ncbi:MAG: heme transporter ATP-binding protein [Nevskia sp.]|nr:heme transporter ATP-binding protein [Nevskia sp.]
MSVGPSLSGTDLLLTRSGRKLLDGVSLSLIPGELHVLLGANGAGKSMLLRVLAGELSTERGDVSLNGRSLSAWTPRQRACLRAVMAQFDSLQADFSVAEVVALGRYPCWQQHPQQEQLLIADALMQVDALQFSERSYTSLSGGERRRVQLARALVQLRGPLPPPLAGAPRYLLLDEPTAGLDLAHRHAGLQLARDLAAEGLGVLAILHDPDLAMRYADRVTLLSNGCLLGQGRPQEVLTVERLRQAYGVRAELVPHAASDRPAIIVRPLEQHEKATLSK